MKVLLIEDESSTAQSIALSLESEGIIYDCAGLGEQGLYFAEHNSYDIIVLDMTLPDVDGYDVLLKLKAGNSTPILILSGSSTPVHKIKSLRLGADDYMTKPFSNLELLTRIRSIASKNKADSLSTLCFDKLSVHPDLKRVYIEDTEIHLTKKEYAVLELLATKHGTVVTREMLFKLIYGKSAPEKTRVVDVVICNIRSKCAKISGESEFIDTVWGRGYILGALRSSSK